MVKRGNIFIPLSGKWDFGGKNVKNKLQLKQKSKQKLKEKVVLKLIEGVVLNRNEVD